MSSSDKAKSKLLDSMRISKQGPTEQKAPASKPAATKASKPTASKPATKKAASTTKRTKAPAKKAAAIETANDSFQAAPRVWPD